MSESDPAPHLSDNISLRDKNAQESYWFSYLFLYFLQTTLSEKKYENYHCGGTLLSTLLNLIGTYHRCQMYTKQYVSTFLKGSVPVKVFVPFCTFIWGTLVSLATSMVKI